MGLFTKKIGVEFLKRSSNAEEHLVKLEYLQSNCHESLKKEIGVEIAIMKAGIIGENRVAYALKNSGIEMYVLQDIYLEVPEDKELSAQIDYLVITHKHVYVLECKNMAGNIEITNSGDFYRYYELDGEKIKKRIYSPYAQNERHLTRIKEECRALKGIFTTENAFEKEFNDIYKSLIVFANTEAVLNSRYAKREIKEKVVYVDQLASRIKEMDGQANRKMDNKEMLRLGEFFLSLDSVQSPSYLKKYEEFIRRNQELKNTVPRDELLAKLKEFRRNRSTAEGIKPYYIFNDATLEELLKKNPRTKEELKGVSGFGDKKVEKYGEEILRILGNC